MTRSGTQSIKSGRSTPINDHFQTTTIATPTKNQSRRASMAQSLHRAYGEVKNKGLCNVIPTRFVVVFVAALANTLSYIMRTNMSVTIVAMVNHTSSAGNTGHEENSCPVPDLSNNTASSTVEGEFNWDETMQGHILGSYYYGYIATNINGGQLADMFGARWLCGLVTLFSAVLTLVTPFVARWDVYALIVLRVFTGLAQGVLTPAIYSLLAHWIPRHERGLVLALIQVGGNMGAVVATIFSGFLSEYGFAGGWPSVFYVFGISGILCFFIWMYVIYNTPDEHPRILDEELIKIKLNTNVSSINKSSDKNKKQVPWLAIITSMPVWAISVAKFCGAWGNLMLMSKLPSYLKSVLHVSIQNNGYITSAVYVALSISLTSFGFFSDWIGQKKLISDTLSRKIFESIALGGPAICLLLVPTAGCDLAWLIILLVVAMIIFGLNAGGDKPVVVDVAPDHSGTIYGITNAIASLPGIFAPLVVGFLIGEYGGIQGWNLVFYSSAGVYIFGLVFFVIFGTAKPQPWGIIPSRSRQPTAYSRYSANNSRMASRVASRAGSRAPSRKATFVENNNNNNTTTPNSKAPSRRATFRQQVSYSNDTRKIDSKQASKMATPLGARKFQQQETKKTTTEPPSNGDIFYTIDLDINKAITKVQQQLGDRIESETNDDYENSNGNGQQQHHTPSVVMGALEQQIITEVMNFDAYNCVFTEYEIDMRDGDPDEMFDDEEEEAEAEAERLQFFQERRYSVFPIA